MPTYLKLKLLGADGELLQRFHAEAYAPSQPRANADYRDFLRSRLAPLEQEFNGQREKRNRAYNHWVKARTEADSAKDKVDEWHADWLREQQKLEELRARLVPLRRQRRALERLMDEPLERGAARGLQLLEEQRQRVVPSLDPERLEEYFARAPAAPNPSVARRRLQQLVEASKSGGNSLVRGLSPALGALAPSPAGGLRKPGG